MGKLRLGEKGFSVVSAVVMLGALGASTLYLMKQSDRNMKKVSKNLKNQRLIPLKEKITRLSGYFVANNFIVCKNGAWENGNPANSCQWNDQVYAGDEQTFDPDSFGLSLEGLDENNALSFKVDMDKIFPNKSDKKLLTGKDGTLKFKLVSGDEVKSYVLKKIADRASSHDKSYIKLDGTIEYRDEGGKEKTLNFSSFYKRPLAMQKVSVTASSCVQRCNVGTSESPSPSCRSEFVIDEDTASDITAKTRNLGPGVIYSISYARVMSAYGNTTQQEKGGQSDTVDLPIDGFMRPGDNLEWSDSFPCVTAHDQINVTKEVYSSNFINPSVDKLLDSTFSMLLPQAHAQRVTGKTVDSSTALSQHSNAVGTLVYSLDGKYSNAKLEPFRTIDVIDSAQEFSGLRKTKTVTTTIFLDPPH